MYDGLGDIDIMWIHRNLTMSNDQWVAMGRPRRNVDRQYRFGLTGTMSQRRSIVSNYIAIQGHQVHSNITKNTDYLVVGDNPGGTKREKARRWGIPEISEEALYRIINMGPAHVDP